MSALMIRVEQLGKQFHIGSVQQQYDRIGDQLAAFVTGPVHRAGKLLRGQATSAAELDTSIWALNNINFEIQRGEVVGIIGRNGAGKSTLLKILSRIMEPSTGFAEIHGRVGSLLEVGTGFHPELTGRENIYLNGAILGMKKQEINRKFDEIVAFAEIDQFLDTPVKHYSSGMYVRLAFSVAAHLETELLLVDEVLAVGDAAFQKKCLGKMEDVAGEGRTVLFVSHNLGLMQTLCQRGIFIKDGTVHIDSSIRAAVESYLWTLEKVQTQALAARTDRQGAGRIKLVGLEISRSNSASSVLKTGEPAQFVFQLDSLIADASCVFVIFDQFGHPVTVFKSDVRGSDDISDAKLGSQFVCEIDNLLLLSGHYRVDVLIRGGGERQDYVEAAATFDVEDGDVNGRPVTRTSKNFTSISIPHRWKIPTPI